MSMLMIDCTLKVTGKIKSKMLSPNTIYVGYLLFKVESLEELCTQWGWNVGGFGGNFGRIHAPNSNLLLKGVELRPSPNAQ